MPVLDMPIRELEKYMGVNPRPADFDEYWDTAIAEMKAVDPQVVMKEAKFKCSFADCYDMYFTGVNGARIHAKYLKPKHITGKIPAVLQFHGYYGHCGEWFEKLGFVAAGMAVFAMDVRGQGGISEDEDSVIHMKKFFVPVFGEENLIEVEATHANVPQVALALDENKDNKSDLIEWMLS